MGANTFGSRFKVTTFGESHGPAYGVVIDGCPAGIEFDFNLLKAQLQRRRPGQSEITTARQEPDEPEILSGLFENKTLGTPIAIIIRNQDARSQDYKTVASTPRAGHADDVWKEKFGHYDPRGGGRSSGRETLCRVIAGAFAQMCAQKINPKIELKAWTSKVGPLELSSEEMQKAFTLDIDQYAARFPSEKSEEAKKLILEAKTRGNSLGGLAQVCIKGVPVGLGQPVFHKLKADLTSAMMSLGAVTAVEVGLGVKSSDISGLEFHTRDQNHYYGGIRGGISTGEDIHLTAHFKPTSSLLDVAKKGRHDPFIVTRAIPVLESMAWLVLVDHLLWSKTDKL